MLRDRMNVFVSELLLICLERDISRCRCDSRECFIHFRVNFLLFLYFVCWVGESSLVDFVKSTVSISISVRINSVSNLFLGQNA